MPGPHGVIMGVPAHGVRVGEPAQERRHFVFGLGPKNEVPMIGHDAVAENANGMLFPGFGKHGANVSGSYCADLMVDNQLSSG